MYVRACVTMTLFPSANNTQAHTHEDPDTNMNSDTYFKQNVKNEIRLPQRFVGKGKKRLTPASMPQ